MTEQWILKQTQSHKTIYELAKQALSEGLALNDTRGDINTKALYKHLDNMLDNMREEGKITKHYGDGITYRANWTNGY